MQISSKKVNHSRRFNGIMPYMNEKWVAEILEMENNPNNGPDLLGEGKFAEVKFLLRNPINYSLSSWTVQDHQTKYNNNWAGQGFWAFGFYDLKKPVSEITTTNRDELEKFVQKRELFILPWNWIYQFPPSNCVGKTKDSNWDNTFRYAKISKLPKIKSTHKVRKGLVHLTQRVPRSMFDL